MSFRDLLKRVWRVWRWSTLAAVAFVIVPLFAPAILFRFARGGMIPLDGRHYFGFEDAFKWSDWLLHVGVISSLASAFIALGAGAVYLIGKRLPDYTDIV